MSSPLFDVNVLRNRCQLGIAGKTGNIVTLNHGPGYLMLLGCGQSVVILNSQTGALISVFPLPSVRSVCCAVIHGEQPCSYHEMTGFTDDPRWFGWAGLQTMVFGCGPPPGAMFNQLIAVSVLGQVVILL